MRERKHKAAPPPQHYSLPVQLPEQQLDLTTCRTMLVEFARYLQFARGQTYTPLAHLDSFVDHVISSKPRRVPMAVRRLMKYHGRLQQLLDALCSIPGPLLAASSVYLLLGPSCHRPREAYQVQLAPSACHCTDTPSALEAAGAVDAPQRAAGVVPTPLSRRFIRQLVLQQQTVQQWDPVPGPTKMYLLLRAPPGCPAPPGFTARHGHQLKMRKGFQVHIPISSPAPAPTSSLAAAAPPPPPATAAAAAAAAAAMAAAGAASANAAHTSRHSTVPYTQAAAVQQRQEEDPMQIDTTPQEAAVHQLSQQLASGMQLHAPPAAAQPNGTAGEDVWFVCRAYVKGLRAPQAQS